MALSRLPPLVSLHSQRGSPRALKKYDGLSGPSYTLGRSEQKYSLPPPSVLKPHSDIKSGGLDTWPAHATGQTSTCMTVAVSKDKELRLLEDDAGGNAQSTPKPKFLEQLETFLKKELKALKATEEGASELRLQAHREVFEYLIEDFKTYRPLLAAIKNEYEMMLSHQREIIRQLEPLKQMLVTVSEQCDQKIMFLKEEEKQEIFDLKDENQSLYKRIDELRAEQLSLETQVEKLQEELAAEYLRYRDECDARKLLLTDLNDLKYQQEDMLAQQNAEDAEEEEKDDPLTLKIALRKARDDEAAASRRLNEMIADYGDVVPRRDYESLNSSHRELDNKLLTLQDDFQKLKEEHDALLDVHKQVVQQRDEYYVKSENMLRSGTPRPNWDKCADHVSGGMDRWKELRKCKTSDQLVDVLMAELLGTTAEDSGQAEFFEPQGDDDSVPKYLRCDQKVRNRRLGKRDTALLINDIWKEKAKHDNEKLDGNREDLAEFVHIYLERCFPLETMAREWAYNLVDACERYSHDERIGLFLSILTGEASEEVHQRHVHTTSLLLNHLTNIDVNSGNIGELTAEEMKAALEEFFPKKSEENIDKLMAVAETGRETRGSDMLDYKGLFVEDDEGRSGPFVDEIRRQATVETQIYVAEISAELGDLNPVAAEDLKRAIVMADPGIDSEQLDRYLCWAFNVKGKEDLTYAEPAETKTIVQRLKLGNIKRITEKN